MKRKHIAAMLIAILVLAGMSSIGVMVLAGTSDPTVVLDGSTSQFIFQNVESISGMPNLFKGTSFQNMMPGDSASGTIQVKAQKLSGSDTYADIYLKAESNTASNGNTWKDLKPSATVTFRGLDGATHEKTLVTDGTRIHLGTFHNNQAIDLTVKLDIPINAGNDMANKTAKVDWVFQAEVIEMTTPGSGSGGGSGGGGSGSGSGGGGGSGIGSGSGVSVVGGVGGFVIDAEGNIGPALNQAEHYGYIIGRKDGLVHPEANITRAEVAVILFRMLTDESRAYFWSQTNPYTDIYAEDWCNNAISTLTKAGILNGRTDGKFDPTASITRAEFAAILARFFPKEELQDNDVSLSDVSGHWAEKEIRLAASKGIILGYKDGTYRPNNRITRAEAITIFNRLLDRHPDKDHLLTNMIQWPDNMDTSAWYYADMQEATNSHVYTTAISPQGNYEVWLEMLPLRDWKALEHEWSQANSVSGSGEVISSRNAIFK